MKFTPFLLMLLPALAAAAPLTIDLTKTAPPPNASPYGPGSTTNPQGGPITADSRSFFLDGKPWTPILGEFHYARYPREEWRDELLKMKAGGINTVSTYVFWIHHEEERGKFDWSGQRSLRDFLKLCQELGLKAFVRMGPWSHGEVRNGGFPDWVQNSRTKLRSTDPGFMKLVEPLFQEEAKQMEGLLWKDGGPVIGVQLDNEYWGGAYLLALKELARSVGVDVPFYAVTGWQGGLPKEGLIPLFGGYSDGFWGGKREDYRKEYLFTDVRALNDLGAEMKTKNAANSQLIAQYPYACVEIGGGMMSGYGKRIKTEPDNIAALALAKLGNGNNMPGYYMYQGGINPEGKLSYLNEAHPNQLPTKDYDFQAPLGACGQVREQYHLLREQHLFLQDFGAAFARMPAYFPDHPTKDVKDFNSLRWDMRSDGKSGFLFFSNQQPYEPLPEHKDVQFELKTTAGSLLIPRQPITIPTGSYGIWPVNMDCDGVTLEYATAQPLCRIMGAEGGAVYFFTAIDGIQPELALAGEAPRVVTPGTSPALTAKNAKGTPVTFVVLTAGQGRRLWRASFAGRERAILSNATVMEDAGGLRLQAEDLNDFTMAIFPPIRDMKMEGAKMACSPDGVFSRFAPAGLRQPAALSVAVSQEHPAGPNATSLKGMEEATWNEAAVYTLNIPASGENRHVILIIQYIGDAARLYVGDKLYDDNFFNGDPFAIALWRIPASRWHDIRLKILPYSDGLAGRLPEEARKQADAAKAASALDQITVTAADQLDLRISPH